MIWLFFNLFTFLWIITGKNVVFVWERNVWDHHTIFFFSNKRKMIIFKSVDLSPAVSIYKLVLARLLTAPSISCSWSGYRTNPIKNKLCGRSFIYIIIKPAEKSSSSKLSSAGLVARKARPTRGNGMSVWRLPTRGNGIKCLLYSLNSVIILGDSFGNLDDDLNIDDEGKIPFMRTPLRDAGDW